ncbi:MAG: CDP-alcohol phosphatidyltransferase family protein [Terricaulis sp.]
MNVDEANRRPISQRSHGWAQTCMQMLVKAKISPNAISFSSIVFAAAAGACLYVSARNDGGLRVLALFGGALFCQLRLLANMMDGMVAVEAGTGGPDGPVWNELPDRIADILVLVGAGYAVAHLGLADATLGWAAAVAAVMTAYVREVVRGAGAPADFSGPMAKPHRMFVMTMAALISTFEPLLSWPHGAVLNVALWIVLAGAIFTALNRARRGLAILNKKAP